MSVLHLINDFTRISIIYAAHSKRKESFECSFNCGNNNNNLPHCATVCKNVRLAAVFLDFIFCAFHFLYLDWQTFSRRGINKCLCGSCASNYLIGVNWRHLQPVLAHCCLRFALFFLSLSPSLSLFAFSPRYVRRVNLAKNAGK